MSDVKIQKQPFCGRGIHLTRRQFGSGVAAAALIGAGLPTVARADESIKLVAAAGHPVNIMWIRMIHEVLIPEMTRLVAEGGKYSLDWTEAWGGTLVKIRKEPQALKTNVVDLSIGGSSFDPAAFPLSNYPLYAPFMTTSLREAVQAFEHVATVIPEMEEEWERANIVSLATYALESYELYTKTPITSLDDLRGQKLVMPGPYAAWIRGTGAVAVTGDLTSYYEDIKSGVASGTISLPYGVDRIKLFEVAPYFTEVNIGCFPTGRVSFNRTRFKALPKEVQEAAIAAGKLYAEKYIETQDRETRIAKENWLEKGGKRSNFSAADRVKWIQTLPPIGLQWIQFTEKKGLPGQKTLTAYMDYFRQSGQPVARHWDRE